MVRRMPERPVKELTAVYGGQFAHAHVHISVCTCQCEQHVHLFPCGYYVRKIVPCKHALLSGAKYLDCFDYLFFSFLQCSCHQFRVKKSSRFFSAKASLISSTAAKETAVK